MADLAGGRRSVVNPGTKLWCPPIEVTQFWRGEEWFFVRQENIVLIKRRGDNMKQNLLDMIQVTVWLYTDVFIFVLKWIAVRRRDRP